MTYVVVFYTAFVFCSACVGTQSMEVGMTPNDINTKSNLTLEALLQMQRRISVHDLHDTLFADPIDLYTQHLLSGNVVLCRDLKTIAEIFPNSAGRVVMMVPASSAFDLYRQMRSLGVNVRLDPKERVDVRPRT